MVVGDVTVRPPDVESCGDGCCGGDCYRADEEGVVVVVMVVDCLEDKKG